jgi:hypothetical protein
MSGKFETAKRGRPRGSKTVERDVIPVIPSACKRCGSTQRTPYDKVIERVMTGTIADKAYTHIVWRRTKCTSCGQARIERHYENRPTADEG